MKFDEWLADYVALRPYRGPYWKEQNEDMRAAWQACEANRQRELDAAYRTLYAIRGCAGMCPKCRDLAMKIPIDPYTMIREEA